MSVLLVLLVAVAVALTYGEVLARDAVRRALDELAASLPRHEALLTALSSPPGGTVCPHCGRDA